MPDIPSRKELADLAVAASAVVSPVILGFSRVRADGRVSVLYSHASGIAEYVLAAADVPDALLPDSAGPRQGSVEAIGGIAQDALGWLLRFSGSQYLVSVRVPECDAPTRFWAGSPDTTPLTGEQLARFEAVSAAGAALLATPELPDETVERAHRLELSSQLLPLLLHVLDVRQVFDRLSAIAKEALPHDLLLLRLFSEDLSTINIFARSDGGTVTGPAVPLPYPPSVTTAWEFDIVDDLTRHPLEADRAPTTLGARSALRLPIRFDDRVIGGIGFVSFELGKYGSADVAVGRRLADYVAVGLSHYNLAERLAEQARSNEELRARTTNVELLEELLGAVIDSGDLPDVFGRISGIARKVLPHDAAALMVRLPNGRQARIYASTGFPPGLPEITEVPDEHLQHSQWEQEILDELPERSEPRYVRLAEMGFRSLLRVPIRLDGQFAAALLFLSKARSGFRPQDILVAHRMADRMAVTLARDREIAASRRADEAAARASRLESRVRALTDELDARTGYRRVVGESTGWRQVLTQATQVASTDTTVLLLGESGTGKEVVARFLHRASSRTGGPFIALNCAALPEQLLEAELFGYERGAYTGATQSKPGQLEQASGGTLFLDEVGEMSPSAQAKFLRVLQEREFQRLGGTRVLRTDARIVAATNRDLQRAIVNGQFREDLFYRLNVFAIRLPALRDRRDDILPLSEAFLNEIGRGIGRPPGGISRDARQRLIQYHWPGNVRELRNILERAAILCDGGLITAEHLALAPAPPPVVQVPAREVAAAAPTPFMPAVPAHPTSATNLQTMERAMIEQALQTARFNKSKAAKALGLTRHQLYIRMRKHGFE